MTALDSNAVINLQPLQIPICNNTKKIKYELKNQKIVTDNMELNETSGKDHYNLLQKTLKQNQKLLKENTKLKAQKELYHPDKYTTQNRLETILSEFKSLENEFEKLKRHPLEASENSFDLNSSFVVSQSKLEHKIIELKEMAPGIESVFNRLNPLVCDDSETGTLESSFRFNLAALWSNVVHSKYKLELESQFITKKIQLLPQMNILQETLEEEVKILSDFQKDPEIFKKGYVHDSVNLDQKEIFTSNLEKKNITFIKIHDKCLDCQADLKILTAKFKALAPDNNQPLLVAMGIEAQVNANKILFSSTRNTVETQEREHYKILVDKWNTLCTTHHNLRTILAKFEAAALDENLTIPWERNVTLEEGYSLNYKPAAFY